MSDTPATNAAAFDPFAGQGGEVVDADFSRKLERERDEAREARDIARLEAEEISQELANARKQIEGLNNFANERFDEIQKVRKERDALRARNRNLETALAYSAEGQTLLSKFLQAVKDRDEARALAILLAEAIVSTLEENRHLADGENCTLAKLKTVVPNWK